MPSCAIRPPRCACPAHAIRRGSRWSWLACRRAAPSCGPCGARVSCATHPRMPAGSCGHWWRCRPSRAWVWFSFVRASRQPGCASPSAWCLGSLGCGLPLQHCGRDGRQPARGLSLPRCCSGGSASSPFPQGGGLVLVGLAAVAIGLSWVLVAFGVLIFILLYPLRSLFQSISPEMLLPTPVPTSPALATAQAAAPATTAAPSAVFEAAGWVGAGGGA